MKKLTFILTLILLLGSVFQSKSQDNIYTIEGKSLEIYYLMGTEYKYDKTKKIDISLSIDSENSAFMVLTNNGYFNGDVENMTSYTKKEKPIKPEDVDKMEKKGKIKYYTFECKKASNYNTYYFFIPYDLTFVKFIEESPDNKPMMFSFKVSNMYNGIPELPSIQNDLK